jgi:DDE superfamily endonuclease
MPIHQHRSAIIKRSQLPRIIPLIAGLAAQSAIVAILPFLLNPSPPKPLPTRILTGHLFVQKVMESENSRRIRNVLRMKLEVFQFLCLELENAGGLKASRSVSIEEQVAMFLFTVGRTASNRDVQDRFQHSGETVSHYFHAVLNAINRIVPKYIQLPSTSEIPIAITSNSKFNNFFNDCIGALDGTHIAAKVPEDEVPAFRNRKGYLSQNVLACCELDDLRFTFVFAGWEGSAPDGRVLEGAFRAGFKIPTGKYYLADADYANTPWCLTPYPGVRYHLHEWSKSGSRYI